MMSTVVSNWFRSDPVAGKVAIITGGSQGIGAGLVAGY
jgi:short-subunit dehydrogenase